ncbi:3-hydroxyacyl-CoA dehydrogenase [Streptomyces vietnamensis]|uniref:3-hydroxyacyl-CoA dehydrogenase n=1 Tax=Streptomyces vietnamensis TaxID=362257 RepID=UPI00343B85BE
MRIRIVGAGAMGRGIAQWAAEAGHTVELCDAREGAAGQAVEFIEGMLDRAATKQRITARTAQAALERIHPSDTPTAPADDLDLVIEAIVEDHDAKLTLFRELEECLPARTLLATNTSSLSVTRIAAGLKDPSRLAGLHFFNPAPLMKIVEVIPGALTRPDIPRTLVKLVKASGHSAVIVADTPGFLINHVGRGLATEALALLEESVADVEDIDRIAKDVLGLRMGPFELMDLTGLDVTAAVTDSVWQGFRHSERLRPSYLTASRVAAGLHGRKTGRGFYSYADGKASVGPELPIDGDADRPAYVPGEGPEADALREALCRSGVRLAATPRAKTAPLIFIPTWGTTVADAVGSGGFPADRTMGVDPLSLTTSRRVLAITPATAPQAARDGRAVLARAGDAAEPYAVSVIRDAPGSVAQRLLSSIISVAATLAERSIATPNDIDVAVKAGLGYPQGPLLWGQQVGAWRLLALQRALYRTTGDPRYRPTRWVTERAQLGLPLTQPAADPHHINA